MPAEVDDAGDFLANVRALEAAGVAMVGVGGDSAQRLVLLGAVAALTDRVRIVTNGGEPPALRTLARARAVDEEAGAAQSWVKVAMPADRESWTAMLREQEAAGAAVVVVPWDPRIIDLLRNPEPDDRSDLLMSTG